MIKRTLPIAVALFTLCISISAQETSSPGGLQLPSFGLARANSSAMAGERTVLVGAGSFRSLQNVWYGGGPLTLGDGRSFSFPGTFGWVEATRGSLLSGSNLAAAPLLTTPPAVVSTERETTPQLFAKPDYVGGEVGVFFGKSVGGKHSRDVEAGYILGQIIEGNTQISVGASYGRESGNVQRVIVH